MILSEYESTVRAIRTPQWLNMASKHYQGNTLRTANIRMLLDLSGEQGSFAAGVPQGSDGH